MNRTVKAVVLASWVLSFSTSLALAKSRKTDSRSEIVDFHPTSFEAKGDSNFFFSIGRDLKYSNRIDPSSPTLISGRLGNFLVSPDGSAIAIVVDRQLVVAKPDSSFIGKVATVDSIYRSPKPIGRAFFRDEEFQWSRDSRYVYLIKDEYYRSKGSQLFSSKGELWRYAIEDKSLRLVLRPFPAYNYFLGPGSTVYFSAPIENGGLQLEFFDGQQVGSIATPYSKHISLEALKTGSQESPFYSFGIHDYDKKILNSKGVLIDKESTPGADQIVAGEKKLVTITQGKSWDGYYYCYQTLRSVFLPGDRFLLLNTPYCGDFNGQLLIDTRTGDYQELPKDTRVYVTLNTVSYPHFNIGSDGIKVR